MSKPTLVDRIMGEVIAYGGFAMTRAAVYQDMIDQGHGVRAADYFAFHGPELSAEQASQLIPAERFKEIVR